MKRQSALKDIRSRLRVSGAIVLPGDPLAHPADKTKTAVKQHKIRLSGERNPGEPLDEIFFLNAMSRECNR
jgi:hypothetical protein